MKQLYFRFRVMLMTLSLGLASVFITNGSLYFHDEISVNLPQVESEEVILVFPETANCMPWSGGSHATVPSEETIRELKKECFRKKSIKSD